MHIERRPYSVNPWRLVTSDGREIEAPVAFEHPDLGRTVIRQSISGASRRACEASALALLERLLTADTHAREHLP